MDTPKDTPKKEGGRTREPPFDPSGCRIGSSDIFREGIPFPTLREVVKELVRLAFEATRGNVRKAARLIGAGRSTVYRLLAQMRAARKKVLQGNGIT